MHLCSHLLGLGLSYFLFCSARAEEGFDSLVRTTAPLSPEQELAAFNVPAGFKMELIASEPTIHKVINLAWDGQGQLWATSSREYPWAIPKDKWATPEGHLHESRDAIVVWKDTNGDAIPDKPRVFADKLNVPTGVLPYGKGCIAWSIPNIWYLSDEDGDGVCDQRKILFGPLGWEKDTHGNLSSFRLAPDGWVYATHGFSNQTRVEVRPENAKFPLPAAKERKPTPSAENWPLGPENLDFGNSVELHSGNVFRFRPDGSRVEPWAWGQVNPFGITWDQYGNLYTADCHSNPLTQVIRGAYYPSFGKPHDGLGFGPVLCSHSHGSTGICGPLYIHSDVWGPEFNDNLLVCNPVTSRINRDAVRFHGATPKALELPDFLTTKDPWFRPVDILLAPDGSLYIADFYNKIIGHYEVPLTHPERDRERGRLWRLSKKDAKPWAGNKTFLAPTGDLAKPRQVTSQVQAMMDRGTVDASGLTKLLNMLQECPPEDLTLRHYLKIGLRDVFRLPGALALASQALREKPQLSKDALAEIIQSLRTTEAAAWLLDHLEEHPGDLNALPATLTSLARQIPVGSHGKLKTIIEKHFSERVDMQYQLLQSLATGLKQSGSLETSPLRPWADTLVSKLRALWEKEPEATWKVTWIGQKISPWAMETRLNPAGQSLPVLSSLPPPRNREVEKLTAEIRSRPFACPPELSFGLCGHSGPPEQPPHDRSFVALVDAATGSELHKALPPRNDATATIHWKLADHVGKQVQLVLRDGDAGDAYAWLALGALKPEVVPLEAPNQTALTPLLQLVADWKLAQHLPGLANHRAWEQTKANPATRRQLIAALAMASGQEQMLAEWLKKADYQWQQPLAEALAATAEGARLLCESGAPWLLNLSTVAAKLAAIKDEALKERIQSLAASAAAPHAATLKLISDRQASYQQHGGDAVRGKEVFLTNCALCHKVGQEGKLVGPQLDGAGSRGLERLCEDILDPNREVDPAFQLQIHTLKDGTVQAGMLRRKEGQSLVLADAAGHEQRIDANTIAKTETSPTSIMPPTFHTTIPQDDFRHLLAWLLSQQAAQTE